MRDVLYISDIDNSYHYVDFSDDCISLYNKPSAEKNELVECYKIYYKISPDTYEKTYETIEEDTVFTNYNVSNSFWARKDIGQFSVLLLTVFFIGIFLINIITSCVKKRRSFWGSAMKKIISIIKKIIKKYFLVVLLVLVFVLSAITSSYGVYYSDFNNYDEDPTVFLKQIYDNSSVHTIKYLSQVRTDSEIAIVRAIASHVVTNHQGLYIKCMGINSYYIYLIYNDNPYSWQDSSVSLSYNNSLVTCPTVLGTMRYQYSYNLNFRDGWFHIDQLTNSGANDIQVPEVLINYYNKDLYDYFTAYLNGTETDILNDIDSKITLSNDKLDEIIASLNSVDNSINNDDISGISTNIIADNPLQKGETEAFFEGFYQSVVTAFTTSDYHSIVLPLGFINQNIVISGDLLSYQLERFTDSSPSILDLIHLFWYFTFGIYIFKDIQKYKDEFKSGEVLNKTDTNITTEML